MQLRVRKIKKDDLMIIFEWANDPIVRSQSFNSNLISIEEHSKWFKTKLLDKNTYFYLIFLDSKPIGQTRFDVVDEIATINYSISSEFRGKGIGKDMLRVAIKKFNKECKSHQFIHAMVKSENIASKKIFTNLGFSLIEKYNDSRLLYIIDKQ